MNLRGSEQDLGRVGVKSANMKIMQILYLYMKFSKLKRWINKGLIYLLRIRLHTQTILSSFFVDLAFGKISA